MRSGLRIRTFTPSSGGSNSFRVCSHSLCGRKPVVVVTAKRPGETQTTQRSKLTVQFFLVPANNNTHTQKRALCIHIHTSRISDDNGIMCAMLSVAFFRVSYSVRYMSAAQSWLHNRSVLRPLNFSGLSVLPMHYYAHITHSRIIITARARVTLW